jgi:hypothetical protein
VFTNSFDTDGTGELMRITGNGLVGIGTNQPLAKLHVNSGSNNNYAAILATSTEGNNLVVSSYATQPANCKVFQISHEYSNSPANRNNGYIAFYRGSDVSGGYLDLGTNGISRLFINSAGNIGMGTSVIPSDYKLAVAGKIIATEVMIKLQSEWPDYVFKPGYKLKSISEVESFVKENHHLPGIPDAASVENEGVNMGEMQAKLLQKIEELTLYMIQQNNRIAELESKLTK